MYNIPDIRNDNQPHCRFAVFTHKTRLRNEKNHPYLNKIWLGATRARVYNILQILRDRPTYGYSLRPRRHNKTLITKTSELNDRDFIIINIYEDLY